MPASRAVLTSSRICSSVFSAIRMSPGARFGATISVPGSVKFFMVLLMVGMRSRRLRELGEGRQLVGGEGEFGGPHGILDALRPRGARDRDDAPRERELPRECDLLRADPAPVRALLEPGVR